MNSRRDDDMSQTDLFGQRVTSARVRYHRSMHRRGMSPPPESTNEQAKQIKQDCPLKDYRP